jgi:hypothetical protein
MIRRLGMREIDIMASADSGHGGFTKRLIRPEEI